ncbi:MAG: 3'-5' exonuclease, partial [Armatimonadota bacterium]
PDVWLDGDAWEGGAPAAGWSDEARAGWEQLFGLAVAYRRVVSSTGKPPADMRWDFLEYVRHRMAHGESGGRSLPVNVSPVVTTIHRAKGREYDIVVVPNLLESRFPPSPRGGSRKGNPIDSAEEERLFFVALTRARDECWLVTPTKARGTTRAPAFVAPLAGLAERVEWKAVTRPPAPETAHVSFAGGKLTSVDASFLRSWEVCPAKVIFDRAHRIPRAPVVIVHGAVVSILRGDEDAGVRSLAEIHPSGLADWYRARIDAMPRSPGRFVGTVAPTVIELPEGRIVYRSDLMDEQGMAFRVRIAPPSSAPSRGAHWTDNLAVHAHPRGLGLFHPFENVELPLAPSERVVANAAAKAARLLPLVATGRAATHPESPDTCFDCPHFFDCPRDGSAVDFDPATITRSFVP